MPYEITKEGLEKLKKELKELKTKKAKEIAELLKYAASFGDLSENAGYDDAKERQSWLIRRIMELENIIKNAVVVEDKEKGNRIRVGSKIKILFDGKKEDYELVAPEEVDILKNKISYKSPLGEKLLGKRVGDEFEFEINKKKSKIKILEII